MESLNKYSRPKARLAALLVAWIIGIAVAYLSVGTVLLWQQAVFPPEQVEMSKALSHLGVWLWLKHWSLSIFWAALYYIAAFICGPMAGWYFYDWVANKYRLRRWP